MPRPVLITAGATRNPIDRMRHLSAASSGKTGVSLSHLLILAGIQASDICFMGSPEAVLRAQSIDGLDTRIFGSTRDLLTRMKTWVLAHPEGVVIHAAAVGDYETEPHEGKLSSGEEELVIRLHPTPKIIDHVRDWSASVRLVSFKAAAPGTTPDDLTRIARAQLTRTGSTLVFANVIGALDRGVQLVSSDTRSLHEKRAAALDALAARIVTLYE